MASRACVRHSSSSRQQGQVQPHDGEGGVPSSVFYVQLTWGLSQRHRTPEIQASELTQAQVLTITNTDLGTLGFRSSC